MTRRILVAVYDAELRAELERALCDAYTLTFAEDDNDALSMLRRQHGAFSLLLLDADGDDQLLKRVHDNTLLAYLPVVALGARADDEARLRAAEQGAVALLAKPVNAPLLLATLRGCIRLRETASIMNALQRDKLTGLLNRETFFAEAEKLIKRRTPGYYTLSRFDIDNFKVVNDQYGAVKGDAVLRHVADCLQRSVAGTESLCCRVSADRFAVLFPTDMRDDPALIDAHQQTLNPPCINRKIRIRIGRYTVDDVSLGVSGMYDRAGLAEESIKGRYDVYIAQYDDAMRDRLLTEQQIVGEMRDALQSGAFEVWYQPQFNHVGGAMIGAEALVRWRKGDRLVPPAEFIPIFERNGFIYEMDQFVWEQVCVRQRKWLDQGVSPLPISVNVARRDLYHQHFIEVFTGIVNRYRLPYDLIHVEVTESSLADKSGQIAARVKELIALGFTVEIDDFGSGYSSLNTLKDIPASVLKLDLRFLENTEDSQRGGSILESVVRMSRWLGMFVIAEGVETRTQADYLKSIGCGYVQGYLYAKPMPLAEFEAMAADCRREDKRVQLETVENLDNNAFWDPSSMETLIFNSYVGGACIFEYHDDVVELLRANDRYTEEFGIDHINGVPLIGGNPADYMDAENTAAMFANIRAAIATERESTCELHWQYEQDGELLPMYIRATVRVIARADDRYLLYCMVHNITSQRAAERMEHVLSERLQAILQNTDVGISAVTLAENGKYEYVLFNNRYYELFGYTPQQYAAEVKSPRDLIVKEDFERLLPTLRDMREVGQTGTFDMRAVGRDGSTRFLHVGVSIIAFTDISHPVQLTCFTDVTADHERDERLIRLNQTLQSLMNKTPGGFVQMRVQPDGKISAEYCNEGFLKLVGMDRDTARAVYAPDVLAAVHPDDAAVVRGIADKLLALDEAHNVRCRLRHGKNGYVWALVSGQMTRDTNGEIVFNAYFTDVSVQAHEELLRRELLDNLPVGAELFTMQGDALRIEHLNKRYWELVNHKERDCAGESPVEAVHPDDRARLWREIREAVAQKRDGVCDVRLRYGADSYRSFRLRARIVPKPDGQYAFYTTFAPLAGADMTQQSLLPVILASVMEQTSDYSFVKDRDFRYLCASRAFVRLTGHQSGDDIAGLTDFDLFPPEIAALYRHDDQKLLQSGIPLIDVIEPIPNADGQSREVNTSKYILRNADGSFAGLYGVGRDVTDDRATKTRFELLADNLPGGIAVYTVPVAAPDKLTLGYFSDGFCRVLGYTRDEYRALTAADPLALVYTEDRRVIREQVAAILAGQTPMDCVFRSRVKGEGFRWINIRGVIGGTTGESVTVNTVLTDVTERQQTLERLRVSEEESLLSLRHSGGVICRYTVADHTAVLLPSIAKEHGLPAIAKSVPDAPIRDGVVAPESQAAYAAMFHAIDAGSREGGEVLRVRSNAEWRWMRARYSTIFDQSGAPISAIISYFDVTDEQEMETVYRRWKQGLADRRPESYRLLRTNLNQNAPINCMEGTLLAPPPPQSTFADARLFFADTFVLGDDRDAFLALTDAKRLLEDFASGRSSATMELRAALPSGDTHWLRLTIELVEYPSSTDVEAYMMLEDIDQQKRSELRERQMAQDDPLTGLYNRNAFAERVDDAIASDGADALHAFLMLDLDGFKQLNDTFGHAAGDEALVEIANVLRSLLQPGDELGRLGGDEFVLLLRAVPTEADAERRALRVCQRVQRTYSDAVTVTASVGVAFYPHDGLTCEALYRNADAALYAAKNGGRNTYRVYHADMADEQAPASADEPVSLKPALAERRRRMLIVDDNRADRELLTSIFKDEYIIEKAFDGVSAMMRLKHYGTAISVVLLDLMMAGMNGFDVLGEMRERPELYGVPVIAVSGDEKRETCLRAIHCGAWDFIQKPVEPDILRVRVASAISRAENERLRAQNSYLRRQSDESARYRLALDELGYFVIELDWLNSAFTYDRSISRHLKGHYDSRTLWRILLTDMVASAAEVRALQAFLHNLAEDRAADSAATEVRLRAPDNVRRVFSVHAMKLANEFGLTERIILTLHEQGISRG